MTGPNRINDAKIMGPRQITYLFLLALAVSHGGRLVTFDESIHIGAFHGAQAEHLSVV